MTTEIGVYAGRVTRLKKVSMKSGSSLVERTPIRRSSHLDLKWAATACAARSDVSASGGRGDLPPPPPPSLPPPPVVIKGDLEMGTGGGDIPLSCTPAGPFRWLRRR